MMRKTYYQILGVPENAAPEEIRAARDREFRRFVQMHQAGQPPSKEDFEALETAYAVLGDPAKRAKYDKILASAPAAANSIPDAVTPAAPLYEQDIPAIQDFPAGQNTPDIPDIPNIPNAPNLPGIPPSGEAPETPVEYGFEFTGSGGEYFRIWIVNLLLTIVTLGIYSAWAKVRREQYFHRNTLLDGSGFDYHGNPTAILKGRLIAYGLLIVLNVIWKFAPSFYGIAFLVIFPIVPWLLVRSFCFRAHNTSFRGLRFKFHGTYKGFVALFWPYLLLYLIGTLAQWYVMKDLAEAPTPDMLSIISMVTGGFMLVNFATLPAVFRHFKRFQLNNLSFGGSRFNFELGLGAFWKVFGHIIARIIAVALIFGLFAFILIYLSRGTKALVIVSLSFSIALFYLAVIAVVMACFQSRTANMVWNNTVLEQHHFASSQTFWGVFNIVATNWLFTLLTLGLYWPWGKIRLARYRASHTALIVSGGLDDFIGEVSEEQLVIGEEIADAFDFDIAL